MIYTCFLLALPLLSRLASCYFTNIENCKITTHGREYIGTSSITKNGQQCIAWKEEVINKLQTDKTINYHSKSLIGNNYCRNPTNFPNGPWCFIDENTLKWEYCNIKSCIKDRNWCKDTDKGTEYLGDLNYTKSGKSCHPWINQKTHSEDSFPEKDLNIVGNKCRNPDMSESPWCYYSEDNKKEECDVPKCDKQFSQMEYFGGYDFLKLIPNQKTIISMDNIYEAVTATVSIKLESLNSDILNKTSLWATDYNPICQTDLNEYEYCTIVEMKTTGENYIISYSCLQPLKHLIFISPLKKMEYTIKHSGKLYAINLSPSEQFRKYENKMNEYFQKKNKNELKIPSDQNPGHFFLLSNNAIAYAINSDNQIPITISTVGKGRIAFLATDGIVDATYFPQLKDLFNDVYEKPVESPKYLTKEGLKELISNNNSKSAILEPFIWSAHKQLGEELVGTLLHLVNSGLRVIIGVKPWAYDHYLKKIFDSELKILFLAAGVWPSLIYADNNWRTVTQPSVYTMPMYERLEYAKLNAINLQNAAESITNIISEISIEKVLSKTTFNLIKNLTVDLYSNYLPYIKSFIPCWEVGLTEESSKTLLRVFNSILVSPFGQKMNAPGLSFYPGKFYSNDIPLKDIKMRLNLIYNKEVAQLGLYATPGEDFSVQITQSKSQFCFIYINYHHFDVSYKSEFYKWPKTNIQFSIERNKLQIFSFSFGGLLSISCDEDNDKVEITFNHVVQIPLFDRRNKEDSKNWIHKQRLVSPWTVVASDTLVFVLSSNAIRNFADPNSFLELYDVMVKEEFHLIARTITASRREMVSTDIQIKAGYMHAGYPIGTPIFWVTNPSNEKDYFFHMYNIKIDGEWGLMHELGHNLQETIFTFSGVGEVTNNIFTLVAVESMTNHSSWSPTNGWLPEKLYINDLVNHINNGTFQQWKNNNYLALAIYAQQRKNFGWEFYAQVFRRYNVLLKEIGSISDEDKIQLWIKVTSEISGMNLCPLYELWRWPISQKTEKELSKLPMFLPDDFLTKMVEKRVDEIISKFGGIDLVLRKPFTIPEKIGPLKNKFAIEGKQIIEEIELLN